MLFWRAVALLFDVPNRLRLAILRKRFGYRISPRARIHRRAVFDTRHGGKLIVGEGAEICQGALLAPHGGVIEIAERVYIGPYCVLYGHGGLRIGADSLVAAHAVMIPANHVFVRSGVPIREQGLTAKGIAIGRDVWIGTGTKILDGVSVGDGCVVGAGSVVVGSLERETVSAGVPAKMLRSRSGRPGPSGSG